MRPIEFRAKCTENGEWVCGDLHLNCNFPHIHTKERRKFLIDPETVGQFTGLTDINGREIYEGDIVEYYSTDTYCINPDCEPHVRGYGLRLCKMRKTVVFDEGVFCIDNDFIAVPLAHEGIQVEDIDELKNDPYFDANGYDLESAVGIEVVGNVFDSPGLLKEKL